MRRVLYLHFLSSVLFYTSSHELNGRDCISAFRDFLPPVRCHNSWTERSKKKIRRIKTNEQKNIIREMEQSSAWERDQLFAGLSQDNSAWMHDWDRLCHCESCLSCLSIRFRTSLLILIPRTILRPSSPILHVHSTLPWKESERRWPQSFPYTSTSQSISITWYELLVHNMASSNKCGVGSSCLAHSNFHA